MNRQKLKNILKALDPQKIDFSAFDNATQTLKEKLTEQIQVKTLEDVNVALEKNRKRIDFEPLNKAFDQLKTDWTTGNEQLIQTLNDKQTELQDKILESNAIANKGNENLKTEIEALNAEIAILSARKVEIPDFGKQIKNSETKLVAMIDTAKTLDSLEDEKEKEALQIQFVNFEKQIKDLKLALQHRGGSMNRQMLVEGVDVLKRYTDVNFIGTPTAVTAVNNNTKKRVDITFTGGGAVSLTATADVWVDGNRTDSYTETGSIGTPYKTISAAITGINALSYSNYRIHLVPATYVEGAPLTFPNKVLLIDGGSSTLVVPSGVTFQNLFDLYDISIIGNVVQSDTTTTQPHSFQSSYIQGNITLSGLAVFIGMASDTSGIITINAGAIAAFSGCLIGDRIINKGTLYFDNSNLTRTDNTNYLVDSTQAGSLAYFEGVKMVNNGSGGGLNLSNNAVATQPNEVSAADIVVGGTTNGITCGAGAALLSDYNIFGSSGQIYATGTLLKSAARYGVEFANGSGSVLTMQPSSTLSSWNMTLPDNAGSANQALTTDGNGITRWASVAGVGGTGIVRVASIISVSSTFAAASKTDYVAFANVGINLTLPTAIGNSNLYTVKNVSSSSVLVTTSLGELIDGSASALIAINNQSLDLISNASVWQVV